MNDWRCAGIEELNQAIARGLEPLVCEEPLKLSEWADRYYYLVPESSSIEGKWVTLPFQKGIMNCISNPDVKKITFKKSARVGCTKIMCAAIGYFIAHLRRNQVFYQPTDSDAADFTGKEIDPMLRECPEVGGRLKCRVGMKSKHNTITTKDFWGSTLDILGGKSPRNYRRLTKDVVYYDELDGFDANIGGEGSPLKLGDKRLETSSFPKSIRGSTPRLENSSLIEKEYQAADVRLQRFLPCPRCASLFPLSWELFKWDDDQPATVRVECPECQGKISHSDFPNMDESGRWQDAECGTWLDDNDFFRDRDGNLIPAPAHVAFHIWSAYSYYVTWKEELVAEWLEANAEAEKGDKTKLITFTNTCLGLTYKEEVGESRKESAVTRLKVDLPGGLVPSWALALIMTCDIQKRGIWYEIRAWKADKSSHLVDYGYLVRDFGEARVSPGVEGDFAALAMVMRKRFLTAEGHEYGINFTVIDSGYGERTGEVYDFCKLHGNAVPAKGWDHKEVPFTIRQKDTHPDTKRPIPGGIQLVHVDTTYYKDALARRLMVNPSDPGSWTLHADTGDDYARQYTAERRNEKENVWQNPSESDNHLWDCGVLQLVAFEIREKQGLWEALEAEMTMREMSPAKRQPPKVMARAGYMSR